MRVFNFGRNWESYSRLLDQRRLAQAQEDLGRLLSPLSLAGRSFLDVGCGSGLSSLAAWGLGARPVLGLDLDPLCVQVSTANAQRLAPGAGELSFRPGSALDAAGLEALGQFDVVHSWGVLHHTGQMYRAIDLVRQRVKPGGHLVLAIYNRHFTSRAWHAIKRRYNRLPQGLRPPVIYFFAGVIALAKLVATRQNPFRKDRGMDFMVDVVDWVGGFPYEYASAQEIVSFLQKQGGLELVKLVPCDTPIGCNQMIFRRGGGE